MAKKSSGRPEFKPTPRHRQQVEQLIGCGVSQDEVARAIGISTPTLVKHFAAELSHGVAKKRSEIIGMLFKAAKGGNVTAQKKLEEMNRIAAAVEAIGAPEKPVKAPKLGKKEERQAAADAVTGMYAPPSPPKLVVNNQ